LQMTLLRFDMSGRGKVCREVSIPSTISVYICIYVYSLHSLTHSLTHSHTHVHIHTYTYIHAHIHTYICAHTGAHTPLIHTYITHTCSCPGTGVKPCSTDTHLPAQRQQRKVRRRRRRTCVGMMEEATAGQVQVEQVGLWKEIPWSQASSVFRDMSHVTSRVMPKA
jgi:hypothetical protein